MQPLHWLLLGPLLVSTVPLALLLLLLLLLPVLLLIVAHIVMLQCLCCWGLALMPCSALDVCYW